MFCFGLLSSIPTVICGHRWDIQKAQLPERSENPCINSSVQRRLKRPVSSEIGFFYAQLANIGVI